MFGQSLCNLHVGYVGRVCGLLHGWLILKPMLTQTVRLPPPYPTAPPYKPAALNQVIAKELA